LTFDPLELGQSNSDLAAILRELRRRAGLSGVQLGGRAHMSQSKISKIENARLTPSLVDVELLLRALKAPPDLAASVLALARKANTEWQGHRALHRKGLDTKQIELAALEKTFQEFRYFLPTMITGLLATPEYVHASMASARVDVAKVIARKIERQAILHDESKKFTFILTEQACRWSLVPGHAMAMQLDRLVSVSRLPGVRLGVIPLENTMPKAPLNVFTVYGAELATVEVSTGALVFRDPRDVREYLDEFSVYEGYARWGEEARARLFAWAQAFRE
jgi:transcriptional regulator with XRE-family HTH domain